MLVLTRKLGESITIDKHIKVVIVQVKGKQVRLGIEAPRDMVVHRQEVYESVEQQNNDASQSWETSVDKLSKEINKS